MSDFHVTDITCDTDSDVWHPSESDPKEHYGVVCQDAAGTYLETIHVDKPVGRLAAEGAGDKK